MRLGECHEDGGQEGDEQWLTGGLSSSKPSPHTVLRTPKSLCVSEIHGTKDVF